MSINFFNDQFSAAKNHHNTACFTMRAHARELGLQPPK